MAEQNGSSDAGRGPDYDSAEYRAYKRAVDRGDVSFHLVASAWFDWHWGPDDCPVLLRSSVVRSARARLIEPSGRGRRRDPAS